MNKIMRMLSRISNYGVKADTSQSEARHIQFANYCSLISILGIITFCSFDSIIAFKDLWEPILVSLLYIPFFILIIYLNEKGYYSLARNLLAFLCISLTFIIAAFYFGKEVREHSLFILFAGVALLVNPIRNWKTILLVATISILAYLYIEFMVDSSTVKTPYPSEFVNTYKIFTNLFSFLTFILILVVYEIRITRKEEIIESHINDLEEINKGLIRINEEVRLSHDLLVKLNSKKNQMFSIIAHDLRGPIGNIMVTSEIISQSIMKGDNSTAEFFTNRISEASKNTFSLLEDLIIWSRTQINNIQYNPIQVKLNDIIPELLKLFKAPLTEKRLKVETLNPDLEIYEDYNMLSTVIRNLLSNAIKFSYPEGKIEISANYAGNMVEIIVKDYGIGMTENLINNIMEGGEISSMPGTCDEKGTGLGLLICRELILKNHGNLLIKSAKNKGTEFIVKFPLLTN